MMQKRRTATMRATMRVQGVPVRLDPVYHNWKQSTRNVLLPKKERRASSAYGLWESRYGSNWLCVMPKSPERSIPVIERLSVQVIPQFTPAPLASVPALRVISQPPPAEQDGSAKARR